MPDARNPVRILHLEDNPTDAELVRETLLAEGLECAVRRVDTEAEFEAALETERWDLILADYVLPSFDGLAALVIARKRRPEVPFLFVSGNIDEERAVEALRNGATDYVLKTHRTKLAPAVRRALEEAAQRAERSRSQAILRASEIRYRSLFERNLAGFFRSTPEGRILDCNEAFARLFGCDSRAEMMACDASDLYPDPTDRVAYLGILRRERQMRGFESQMRRKDGVPIWVLCNVNLVTSPEDGGEVLEGTVVDVTPLHRALDALHESDELKGRIVASAREGIVVLDREFRYVVWNPAMEDMTGLKSSALLGRRAGELYPQLLEPNLRGAALRALAGEGVTTPDMEFTIPDRRNSIWLSARMAPLQSASGEISGIVILVQDLTERRRAEEQARRQLEEVGRASRLIMAGQMAAAVAHEVSQPLSAAANFVESAARGLRASPERIEKHLELLRLAGEQVAAAGAMLRRTLGFVGRWDLHPEALDVVEVARQAVLLAGPEARARRVEMKVVAPARTQPVQADRMQVQEVFVNLLRNSIEAIDAASPPERRIVVTVAPAGEDRVRVSVADTGPGFPAEARAALFEAFRSTKAEGLGLGLWLCRNIVEAHGGEIALAPCESGARLEFWIPSSPRAPLPAQPEAAEVGGPGRAEATSSGGRARPLRSADGP